MWYEAWGVGRNYKTSTKRINVVLGSGVEYKKIDLSDPMLLFRSLEKVEEVERSVVMVARMVMKSITTDHHRSSNLPLTVYVVRFGTSRPDHGKVRLPLMGGLKAMYFGIPFLDA